MVVSSHVEISDRQDDADHIYHEHPELAHRGVAERQIGQRKSADAAK